MSTKVYIHQKNEDCVLVDGMAVRKDMDGNWVSPLPMSTDQHRELNRHLNENGLI